MSSVTRGCVSLVRLGAWGWRANCHGVARRASAARLAGAIIPERLTKVRCVLRISLDERVRASLAHAISTRVLRNRGTTSLVWSFQWMSLSRHVVQLDDL